VTDPKLTDNPMVFANPGFLTMTGYTAEEIIGKNCRFLQGPETAKETINQIREAIADQKSFRGEFINYTKDGTEFWNNLTINPVFDENNELINFVGIQENVTERRHIADQLHQNFEKLKELEQLRDNLTGMLVHDLRSPLAAIIASLEILKVRAWKKINSDEKEIISLVMSSALSLKEMITSMLDVSRMEAKEMPVHIQHVDLRNVIMDIVESFLPLLETRTFEQHITDKAIIIPCDADLMKRILTNLLGNAVKFTPVNGKISITVDIVENKLRISVFNTGTSIPKEYHMRIFEKFGQVGEQKERHSTGLGLTFCKLAIEAQGGIICVDSSEGEGVTFWIELNK